MQNYHRHSCYSNIFVPDSAATNEEYAKRAKELGHKIISSVEHGWQGYYFETYELAKKYDLKFVFGAEAYWVKDRKKEYEVFDSETKEVKKDKDGTIVKQKDKKNCHVILLAKNENGRQAINSILSTANIDGYYFKPRVDLELLLSLPSNDVFVTTACIAFWQYDDSEEIVQKLYNHFGNNFMLEIQYHNTKSQIELNKKILYLSKKYNIKMIVGLDSHYIYESDSWKRDYILETKKVHYDDEEGWYMDYPSDDIVFQRFKEQQVFSDSEIREAMDNTDITLSFDDYDNVNIFTKNIKLPTLYPNLTKEEKDNLYGRLITKKYKEYIKEIPKEEQKKYFDGVKKEVQTYKDTGMTDYPLLDYEIVKDAVNHGGLITNTGRGSAVGYFTNTLCGFSKVDRFKSAIKLYPERFISKTRILETHSLPDIDLNVGTPEIFEQAQINVLGRNHVYPMIAFGTLKKKAAFKLYAKAQGLDFSIANKITDEIGKYDEALKYAEDDEKDTIDLYDYVDEKYKSYIEASEEYWGIISDKKKAPSAYLLYQGDIPKEIGLIKCKSESTKKEYITCVIDGAIGENYKFLKNDILKVDVVLLIDKIFKRIGIEPFNVDTLLNNVKNDTKVWDLYANGYTVGLNQTERKKNSDSTVRKVMKYKPRNVSELTAFIAAIRPGFKSMYSKFESREPFSYNIPAFDKIIQTPQFPYSYVLYQEQTMNTLNYAGFPLDECYGIIKAIAKKHPEKVKPLKSKFIDGFANKIIEDENISSESAYEMSRNVWQIISNSCGYSFNSSHAFCMALDSLYNAWQKANYPYEFYEVMLQHYSDKKNKTKVSWIKEEMKKAFNITEGVYRFGTDNRRYVADKQNHCINPALSGIKGLSQKCADELYALGQNSYGSFLDILMALKETSVDRKQLDILIKIDYFHDYGEPNELLKTVELFNAIYGKKQFAKSKIKDIGIPVDVIEADSSKKTEKTYGGFDSAQVLMDTIDYYKDHVMMPKTSLIDRITYQQENFGYIQIVVPRIRAGVAFVQSVDGERKRTVTLYRLKTGETEIVRVREKQFDSNPFEVGQIIETLECSKEKRWKRNAETGEFYQIDDLETILRKWNIVRC